MKTPETSGWTMRPTDGKREMQWLVMVVETNGTDHEWCESEALANTYAAEALKDAREGEYTVSVYVLKCVSQNGEGIPT